MHRLFKQEQLDDLSLSGPVLHKTLAELGGINRWLGSRATVLAGIKQLLKRSPHQKTWTIIDLGCGGGDLLHFLGTWFRNQGLEARFIGIDGNPASLAYAGRQTPAGLSIQWMCMDLLQPDCDIPECDIVVSSHFLYHLRPEPLTRFIDRQSAHVSVGWVINELIRNRLAVYGFKMISFSIGLSPLTREDGILAIRRALRPNEWRRVLALTGKHYRVIPRWVFRQLILIDLT